MATVGTAQYQYKPTVYGEGKTVDQLMKLYGSNPSLVTVNTPNSPTPTRPDYNQVQGAMRSQNYTPGGDWQVNGQTQDEYGNPYAEGYKPESYGQDFIEGMTKYSNDPNKANEYALSKGVVSLPTNTQVDQYGNPYTLDKSGNEVYTSAGKYAPDYDEPVEMSDAEAYSQAYKQINPIYDSLRQKAEFASVEDRELIPQMMAARWGMSGVRGGRITSTYQDQTQKEAATMNDIEGRRQQAAAEMAQAIKKQDWDKAMDLYKTASSLAIQQQQMALQASANETDNWYKRAAIMLQMQGFTADEAQRQLENNPLYWKNAMDMQGKQTDMEYKKAQITGMNLENEWYPKIQGANLADTYSAINSRNTKGGTSGSGGGSGGKSSSGSDLTANQEDQSAQAMTKWVTSQVENDDRLLPDRSNYLALADAWKNMYIKTTYGG